MIVTLLVLVAATAGSVVVGHGEKRIDEPPQPSMVARVVAELADDIDRGRRFSAEHGVITLAHFSIGTDHWSVTSTAAARAGAPTAPTLYRRSDPTRGDLLPQWRFTSFRGLDGRAAAPSFVFFPDGAVQGGEIDIVAPERRATVRMGADGALSVDVQPHDIGAQPWSGPVPIKRVASHSIPR